MILDRIDHASAYFALNTSFRQTFDFLCGTDLPLMSPGRVELDGSRLFALVQHYETKPLEQGVWEAHRNYIDVQYVVSGREIMGYAPVMSLSSLQPYSADSDLATFEGEGVYFAAQAGTFAVFFPHDAHMPGLAEETPEPTIKVVVKIAV